MGEFDQMAWIVMGTRKIRFVSFSDVNDPRIATNWKYNKDEMELINAPIFYLA